MCFGFYDDGISFRVVLSQSFWLRVLPGAARLVQPRWMPERRILGGGPTCGVSFWPFLNSSGWWWLISFMFLTRTSCHKTTHANGYYGTWPGWAVSVSVLPLTVSIACVYIYMNPNLQIHLIRAVVNRKWANAQKGYRHYLSVSSGFGDGVSSLQEKRGFLK